MTYLIVILAIIVIWNLAPSVMILFLDIPWKDKLGAMKCFTFSAAPRGLIGLIPDLLAPIVVPFILPFTKWEDDHLKPIFRWWDNNVSINGDKFVWIWNPEKQVGEPQPMSLEDTPEVRALCYYAPGHHPRSNYARYVWLGLRNRATLLAQDLGYKYKDGENKAPREVWGDITIGRDKEGWNVNKLNNLYQLCIIKRLGPVCIRINYGYKIWFKGNDDPAAAVVNISFSLLGWTGK